MLLLNSTCKSQCLFQHPQAFTLIVAPGELSRSSAKCRTEDHLARIRKTTPPNAIRRATNPISTAANCRWLELLPETKTPFWLCGIAYDSKYPQFGHRNVVTGMTLSLFSTVRPVQKLGWGSPGHQFSRCNPVCVLSGTQPDSMCA